MTEKLSSKEDAKVLIEEALTLEMQHKKQAVERGLLDTVVHKNEVAKNFVEDLKNDQKPENPIIAEPSMTTNELCAPNLEQTLDMHKILQELDAEKNWYSKKLAEIKKVKSEMKQNLEKCELDLEMLKGKVATLQSELDSLCGAYDKDE